MAIGCPYYPHNAASDLNQTLIKYCPFLWGVYKHNDRWTGYKLMNLDLWILLTDRPHRPFLCVTDSLWITDSGLALWLISRAADELYWEFQRIAWLLQWYYATHVYQSVSDQSAHRAWMKSTQRHSHQSLIQISDETRNAPITIRYHADCTSTLHGKLINASWYSSYIYISTC